MLTDSGNEVWVAPDASLRDALRVIDRSASSTCLLIDAEGLLCGLLTDGDVRRALLADADLDDPSRHHATKAPVTVAQGTSRAHVLDLMRARRIQAVPEIDQAGRVLRLHTLRDMIGAKPLPNTAVIMAGGRGTRLGQLTEATPKPLMPVAGRPIIEWIILGLVSEGITDIVVSVNHLADLIVDQLGDGSQLGCRISYVREQTDRPLGTAGSLSLLRRERPEATEPLIVMNGDLMVEFEVRQLLAWHESHAAAITVASRDYEHVVPFGVLSLTPELDVVGIEEKPRLTVAINTALYAVEPAALDRLPFDEPSTMPELIQWCVEAGETVTAWPLVSDWIDIGTPGDLARAKGQL